MHVADALLSVAAYALATIATLRAGSRVSYLISHDEIGVMEGPLILPPNNLTSNDTEAVPTNPLYELANAFRLSVHLALAPQSYHIMDTDDQQSSAAVYDDDTLNELVNELINENSTDDDNVTGSLDDFAENDVTIAANTTARLANHASTIGNLIPELLKRSLLDNQKRIKRFTHRIRDEVLPEIREMGVRTSESIAVHFALTSTASSEAFSRSPKASKKKLWNRRRNRESGKQVQPSSKTMRTYWLGLVSSLKSFLPTFVSSSKRQAFQVFNSLISVNPYSWLNKATQYWIRKDDHVEEVTSDKWEEDFDFSTTVVAAVGVNSTNSTIRPVEITAYAPEGFANLRSRFDVSETEFANSILRSGPYVSFQSNSKGAARTGGIFFFTRDGAFLIKTIRASEAKTLLKMLPKYYNYMKKYARRSLLTRFFGMYKVRLKQHLDEEEKEFIIVIMNSVFPVEASKFLCERFDLKGSTVGRECSVEERQTKGRNAILKDLDLAKEVELVKSFQQYPDGYGLHVGPKAKSMLLSQLRRDVSLLVDCKVMDYSLLVGVVNMDLDKVDESTLRALDVSRREEEKMKLARPKRRVDHKLLVLVSAPIRIMVAPPWYFARMLWSMAERTVSSILTLPLPYYGAGKCVIDGGALSVVHGTRHGNRSIYYMGVIDFLQPWTTRKVLERQIKGMMGYDTSAISCVDPKEYAARFLEFLEAHVS